MIVHTDLLLAPRLPTALVILAIVLSAFALPDWGLTLLLPAFLYVIVHDLAVLVPWRVADGIGRGADAVRWHRGFYALTAAEVALREVVPHVERLGPHALVVGLKLARVAAWLGALGLLYLVIRYVLTTLRELEDPRRRESDWIMVVFNMVALPLSVTAAYYRLRGILEDPELERLGLGLRSRVRW